MKSDVNKYFCIRLKLTVVRSRTSNFKKMETFCKFVTLSLIRYLIFIPPVYEAKPLIQSNEIESIQYKNHKNFHNGLSSLSRFLTSSTITPSTTSTTPQPITSHFDPVHHYSCTMCGMTFSTVEDVKKHYVNQHSADPTVIHAKFHNPYQYSHYINHQPNAAKYPFKCESCPIGRPPFETQAAYADHIRVNVDKYFSRSIDIIHL